MCGIAMSCCFTVSLFRVSEFRIRLILLLIMVVSLKDSGRFAPTTREATCGTMSYSMCDCGFLTMNMLSAEDASMFRNKTDAVRVECMISESA